jgi:hypothetical protein
MSTGSSRVSSAPFAVGGTFAESDKTEARTKARKTRYSLDDVRGGHGANGSIEYLDRERIVISRYPDKLATKVFYTTTQGKLFSAVKGPTIDPDTDMSKVSRSERMNQLAQLSQRAQQDLASVMDRREKLALAGPRGPLARLKDREGRGSFGSDRSASPAPGRIS